MSIRVRAKAAIPYLTGAESITLDILKELRGLVPIPYVQIAFAAACKVVEIAEVCVSTSFVQIQALNHFSDQIQCRWCRRSY